MERSILLEKKSVHTSVGIDVNDIPDYLAATPGWDLVDGQIIKTYQFKNYYETLAFVNAIAFTIHQEDHHPELHITCNRCTVKFNTHTVNNGKGGISENDFICAAKINAIFHQAFG